MGAPRIMPELYAFLKQHPTSLQRLCKAHGFKSRAQPAAAEPAAAVPAVAAVAKVADVLITIPIGNNQTATLSITEARRVYDQLHAVFGK